MITKYQLLSAWEEVNKEMVEFCQKCGNLLYPQSKKGNDGSFITLYCSRCGFTKSITVEENSYYVKTKIHHKDEEKSQIISENFAFDPITREVCPKCGCLEAYYWQGSNRRKSEWESITYFRCVKCRNTWNE